MVSNPHLKYLADLLVRIAVRELRQAQGDSEKTLDGKLFRDQGRRGDLRGSHVRQDI